MQNKSWLAGMWHYLNDRSFVIGLSFQEEESGLLRDTRFWVSAAAAVLRSSSVLFFRIFHQLDRSYSCWNVACCAELVPSPIRLVGDFFFCFCLCFSGRHKEKNCRYDDEIARFEMRFFLFQPVLLLRLLMMPMLWHNKREGICWLFLFLFKEK